MKPNKIFIFLPDGVGLRNFAYSDFYTQGKNEDFEVIFWNNTPFDLTELGFKEIKIRQSKSNVRTESYKNARKEIELMHSKKKSGDGVYDSYQFPFVYSGFKNALKTAYTKWLVATHSSEKKLVLLRKKIKKLERKTRYYQQSIETLQKENPAFVFCTNQRSLKAIAPLLAAQDLGIPTATFIFSWDNLPKATMVVETDYYFVWSNHMKEELLFYYPYIQEKQVCITGTPQFESHFDLKKIQSRAVFFRANHLDFNKKYICYSGDDFTTCPDDPQYLSDVAQAVSVLNSNGANLGIVFRRCPVDFSARYDAVLKKYKSLIVPIAPKWERKGLSWDAVLSTPDDVLLQINTIAHTEMVVNLGSSMVFDYVAHHKPCGFINYDVPKKTFENWSVKKIYQYVHFRSMPNKDAVVWLNNKEEIGFKIKDALNSKTNIELAKDWFETINQHPAHEASKRIWNQIKRIVE